MIDERLLTAEDGRWVSFGPGIDFKLFYASAETGRWTVLFRCQPGSFFGMHKHLGAGEYYVVRGRMTYRMGEAGEGTYGYEPLDVIHDHTAFPEYTELLFTNYGPVAFLNEDGSIASIVDHALLTQMAAAA